MRYGAGNVFYSIADRHFYHAVPRLIRTQDFGDIANILQISPDDLAFDTAAVREDTPRVLSKAETWARTV